MGSYFTYKTDEPAKVNALFFYENRDEELPAGTRVVSSDATIMDDLAYIQVDPDQSHLRDIKTIEAWNNNFPICAWGTGQVKLSGCELTATEELIIEFVVDHSELFTEIDDQSGEYYTPEPQQEHGWWELSYRGVDEFDDCTLEHISDLINQGYNQGEIVQDKG